MASTSVTNERLSMTLDDIIQSGFNKRERTHHNNNRGTDTRRNFNHSMRRGNGAPYQRTQRSNISTRGGYSNNNNGYNDNEENAEVTFVDYTPNERGSGVNSSTWKPAQEQNYANYEREFQQQQHHQQHSVGTRTRTVTLVLVENLDFEITETDLTDLFSKVGPLRRVHVNYDASGRSNGVAELTFMNLDDVQRAVDQYDGVPLDGKPMKLTIRVKKLPVLNSSYNNNNVRNMNHRYPSNNFSRRGASGPTGYHRNNQVRFNDHNSYGGVQGHFRGGAPRFRGGRGGGRRHSGSTQAQKSAVDLDTEMDEYMNQGSTNNNTEAADNNESIEAAAAPMTE